MVHLGLVVRLRAKPGKEREVHEFLAGALPWARAEEFTPAWLALRGEGGTFYIVDAFADEAGREKHLSGSIASELLKRAPELFAEPPHIEKVEVCAAKLPR
jgi:quinol monooxygenase YgiN